MFVGKVKYNSDRTLRCGIWKRKDKFDHYIKGLTELKLIDNSNYIVFNEIA